VVVVADDRLARRSGDYERFVDALTHQEGRVYADARGRKDLYSEDVEGMGLIGVAFAKIETRKIKRRMRRSHRSWAELGKAVGSTRPFGWLDDRITLDPVEAPLLAKAVEQFIVGRSMHSIVLGWQQLGVQTVLGNQWTTRSLRVTLANPRMCAGTGSTARSCVMTVVTRSLALGSGSSSRSSRWQLMRSSPRERDMPCCPTAQSARLSKPATENPARY
jgi:hypothetical protein